MPCEEALTDVQLMNVAPPTQPNQYTPHPRTSQHIDAGYQEKSDSPEWDRVMESMADEIRVRHISDFLGHQQFDSAADRISLFFEGRAGVGMERRPTTPSPS
jgi:hypothetical protein